MQGARTEALSRRFLNSDCHASWIVSGVAVLFTTPLGMRIDEGLGGTPADLSARIFGPDLDELSRLAEQAKALIRGVAGIADLRAEQLTGLPQLQIAVNREATARVAWRPAM